VTNLGLPDFLQRFAKIASFSTRGLSSVLQ